MRAAVLVLSFMGICFLAFVPSQAQAQAQAQGSDADLAKRMELAREMHRVRPMDVQIGDAIRALSQRYAPDKRDLFVAKMLQVFDQKTLTEISIRAMAETFTAAELAKLVDFNGSPEGRAISEKMPVYQSIVEPELMKKIDQAMMELRTGAPGVEADGEAAEADGGTGD